MFLPFGQVIFVLGFVVFGSVDTAGGECSKTGCRISIFVVVVYAEVVLRHLCQDMDRFAIGVICGIVLRGVVVFSFNRLVVLIDSVPCLQRFRLCEQPVEELIAFFQDIAAGYAQLFRFLFRGIQETNDRNVCQMSVGTQGLRGELCGGAVDIQPVVSNGFRPDIRCIFIGFLPVN